MGNVPGYGGTGGDYLYQTPVELYNAMPPGIATYSSIWFDWRNGKRLLIDIVSTLNQAVVIQLVGNMVADFNSAKAIGGPLNCPAYVAPNLSGLDIGLAWDDWHPYIGVLITTAVAPVSGTIVVNAIEQK
jgi:hypothetical protein